MLHVCQFDYCAKHDKKLHNYPCHECGEEWAVTHPKTKQAIADLVSHKITVEEYRRIAEGERSR